MLGAAHRLVSIGEWRPIVDGALRQRVRAAAAASVAQLVASPRGYDLGPAAAIELGDGDAGLGVALEYFADSMPQLGVAADDCLERVAEGIACTPLSPWWFNGTCGVAWAWHHLEAAHPDVLATVDAMVAKLVAAPRFEGGLGLHEGLAGVAMYLLERSTHATDEALRDVVRHFEARAEWVGEGAVWRRAPEQLDADTRVAFPRGYVDLGMFQGVAGLLAVLCRIYAAGIERRRTARLIDASVRWFRELECSNSLPAWSSEDERGAPGHGWCAGGLGIGTSLVAASAVLDDRELGAWGVDLLVSDATATAQRDRCLCHGLAGTAQLAARAFVATGDARLPALVSHALTKLTDSTADINAMAKRGVLVGAAGAALVLLAATEERDPAWDRIVLASAPH